MAYIVVMNIPESSFYEYKARVNKVMDYIEQNLDKPINLKTIAAVANFSSYHFHRIFTILVGETPNNFLQRIRLERSASALINNANEPINDIAYRFGFTSASSFSRAFNKQFGITAKGYREAKGVKKIQDSKNGKSTIISYAQLCATNYKNVAIMKTEIEIKDMPAMQVIYCRHTGAFNQIGKAYEKLMKWAWAHGLLGGADIKCVTVYHDDPSVTSIDKMRQSACLIINTPVKVEGEIGKMTIEGGKYAVGRFEVSETEFEQAWNIMCEWFTQSNCQPGDGCTYEIYHNDHLTHPERKFIIDICIPVKPL